MNAITRDRTSQPLLRRAFAFDALATGGLGAILAIGAPMLQPLFNLPVALLREAGLICIVFALWLAFALSRPLLTRGMARFAIGVNIAWVLGSFALLVGGWAAPTVLGTVFVVAQALVVVVFLELQYLGAKRAFGS